MWQMEKLLIISNFTFATLFQKSSAVEASKCIYLWERVKVLVIRRRINPSKHIDTFWCICSRRLLKTLCQKKKLLKTSNFSFCHNVFNLFFLVIIQSFLKKNYDQFLHFATMFSILLKKTFLITYVTTKLCLNIHKLRWSYVL